MSRNKPINIPEISATDKTDDKTQHSLPPREDLEVTTHLPSLQAANEHFFKHPERLGTRAVDLKSNTWMN
jgi:hypothetical protein